MTACDVCKEDGEEEVTNIVMKKDPLGTDVLKFICDRCVDDDILSLKYPRKD
jgi:hypothetical protein